MALNRSITDNDDLLAEKLISVPQTKEITNNTSLTQINLIAKTQFFAPENSFRFTFFGTRIITGKLHHMHILRVECGSHTFSLRSRRSGFSIYCFSHPSA